MSTPFDINVPVAMGEDVVLNFEDGTQVVGTPQELIEAASAGNIIGLHVNPAVIIPGDVAPEAAAEDVSEPAEAPLDTSTDTTAPAATEDVAPTEVPTETPVETDTVKLDEDVKTLEADEAAPSK